VTNKYVTVTKELHNPSQLKAATLFSRVFGVNILQKFLGFEKIFVGLHLPRLCRFANKHRKTDNSYKIISGRDQSMANKFLRSARHTL